MTKRLSDTEALKSQRIKEAGNEFAGCKSPHWDEPNRLEPATDSADWAVDANKRRTEREDRMNNPVPYVAPSERAEYSRKTNAGNSSLSSAVRICRE